MSRSHRYRIFAAAGLLALLTASAAQAGHLSRDLEALSLVAGGAGRVEVIVTYTGAPGGTEEDRLRGHGAEGVRPLRLVRGLGASVPVARLRVLASDPGIRGVAFDEPVHAASDVAAGAIGAFTARQALGIDGSGVRVAVLDSGVAAVADLDATAAEPLGRIAAWIDLVEPHRTGPVDPYGHGTHVAGLIAGAAHEIHDPGSRRVYGGMAPGAEIVSVRVLDRVGNGRASDVIAGLEWAVDHADELGIRVVNLSLGHPIREPAGSDPLVQAVEAASETGLLVVVSAGNLGRASDPIGTITSPGNAPRALTVGALNDHDTQSRSDDDVTSYSSLGPTRFDGLLKPDLLAPGDALVSLRSPHSTLDRSFPDNRVGSDSRRADAPELFQLSGTSMAAAVTAGAAALLLSAEPSLDAASLKARLMRSAEKRTESTYQRGAGALDLLAALDDRGGADAAPTPAALLGPSSVQLAGIEGWGSGWELEQVYGPVALWDLDLAWDALQAAATDEPEELIWQLPTGVERARDLVWVRAPSSSGESVVWQNDGQLQGESVVWQNDGQLQGESVVWQNDGQLQGESVVWQNDGQLQGESVVWQNDGQLQGESVVWQNDGQLQGESVVWQNDGQLQGESVVWQNDGQLQGESVVWQNEAEVGSSSVVWQSSGEAIHILIHGDAGLDP